MSNLSWLDAPLAQIRQARHNDQMPHALLLHGPAGIGRLALAGCICAELLAAAEPAPQTTENEIPASLAAHPDFLAVQPLPDKRSIAVDQIRDLIGFLALTSHQKGAKVALIEPADALTKAAANALLKTLEEPPANTLLVLIANALSRLPATVLSRCQRLRVRRPERSSALAWLKTRSADIDWEPLLEQTGGAPLAALAVATRAESGRFDDFCEDLERLGAARVAPAAVARKWCKQDADIYLVWLYRRVAAEIRQQLTGEGSRFLPRTRPGSLQYADKMLNMDRSFEVLAELSELRRLQGSGINAELHLSKLLSHWYGT